MRKTSSSSPAPWTFEWEARICSTKVVPDRGKPTTKTGRGSGSTQPRRRVMKSGGNEAINWSMNFECSSASRLKPHAVFQAA